MIFRQVNERVTFDNHLKRYFMFWAGDELLLDANNDAEAIHEAEELLIGLGYEG